MPTFDDDALAWFKTSLALDAALFVKLVQAGEQALQQVEARWPRAQAAGDADHLEHLADVGAEALDQIDHASELALVGGYHWVERTTKRVLTRLLRSRGKDTRGVSRMNYDELSAAFTADGVNFRGLANEPEVNLLRLFANSWKHQVGDAAQPALCRALGVPEAPPPAGHLTIPVVREPLARRFGLQAGASSAEIVRAAVPQARDFLQALAEACP